MSDAAYRPLVNAQGADWAKSAILLMKQISRAKKTAVTPSTSIIATIVMIVVIAALFVIVAIVLYRRNYVLKQVKLGFRKAKRRHASHK